MKKSKNYNHSTALFSQAKQVMLEMLLEIDKICAENHLTYFLAYGTCLGAVRHKGFIPWDDDIDIAMPRASFELFCHLIEEKYSQKYDITSPILSDNKKYHPFAKIYKKGTKYIEEVNLNNDFPKGIFVDIFPFDYLPNSTWQQKINTKLFMFLENIILARKLEWFRSSSTITNLKQAHKIKYYTSKWGSRMITLFFSIPTIRNIQQKLATRIKKSNFISCYFNDKPYKVSDILPVSKAEFEGYLFPVAHHVDKYLTICFDKDYMQLPPMDQRRTHGIVEIECEQPVEKKFVIQVKKPKEMDLKQVANLIHASFGKLVTQGINTPTVNITAEELQNRQHTYYFCAYEGKKLIGIVNGKLHENKSCYLDIIAVLPEYNHLGIGSCLLEAFEKQMFGSGIKYIFLNTMLPAKENIQWYEKHGYIKTSLGRYTTEYFSVVFRKYSTINRSARIKSFICYILSSLCIDSIYKNPAEFTAIGSFMYKIRWIYRYIFKLCH